MPMDPASVTSRANADLCAIELYRASAGLSPAARMLLIATRSAEFMRNAEGSTELHRARREADARKPF